MYSEQTAIFRIPAIVTSFGIRCLCNQKKLTLLEAFRLRAFVEVHTTIPAGSSFVLPMFAHIGIYDLIATAIEHMKKRLLSVDVVSVDV